MKNKYSGLSTEEQIKRYKKENKTLLVCAIICSIVVVTISILFFVYDLDRSLAIGLLVVLPFSTTEAPITGSPLVSFTLPFTVIVCPDTLSDIAENSISNKERMFFTLLDILCMFIN